MANTGGDNTILIGNGTAFLEDTLDQCTAAQKLSFDGSTLSCVEDAIATEVGNVEVDASTERIDFDATDFDVATDGTNEVDVSLDATVYKQGTEIQLTDIPAEVLRTDADKTVASATDITFASGSTLTIDEGATFTLGTAATADIQIDFDDDTLDSFIRHDQTNDYLALGNSKGMIMVAPVASGLATQLHWRNAGEATLGIISFTTIGKDMFLINSTADKGIYLRTSANVDMMVCDDANDDACLFKYVTVEPRSTMATCDAAHEGTITYDSDINVVCFCDASIWCAVYEPGCTSGTSTNCVLN